MTRLLLLLVLILAWPTASMADDRISADGVVVAPASGPAKRVRVQVLGPRLFRVTASPTARIDAPASLMVTARPVDRGFTVREQNGVVVVATAEASAEVSLADGRVRFRDATGRVVLAESERAFTPVTVQGQPFYAIRQQFNPGTREGFYGLGQHQNRQMDYNGEDVELAQYNRVVAVPFLLSTNGYGVLWDNNGITRFGNPRPYAPASRDLMIRGPDGKPGFAAKYYVGGELKLTRIEADIDYAYLKDQPRLPALLKDAKDARVVWEGTVEPKVGGLQRFKLYSSDYAKVWVDGRLVLDRWRQNWNPWHHNFDVAMAKGARHKIRVEWRPSGGYIALWHNDPMPEADRHSLQLSSEVGQNIDYYFVAGRTFDETISGYRTLTGRAVLMPRWAYGFWQSRQRYETQEQLLSTLREHRRRRLPIDAIVQDWFYWREDDWGSHVFDAARFPDPKAMVDEVHRLNARIMISIWPKFYPTTANFRELDAKGFIYRRNLETGAKDWVGPGYANSFYDPYAAEARSIYWRQVRERLRTLGIDAWWMDSDEPDMHSNLDVPERTLRMGPTALGPGAAYFNSYSLPHTTGVFEGERALDPDRRTFILSRSGFGGIQRNGVAVWSGDIVARWDDLADQVSAGVNLSMSGIPNWTQDIGGFSTEARFQSPDAAALDEWRELNLRWFQFGAFSPIFRSHGEAPFREVWNLAPEGSEVYAALEWASRLRYRLLPYVYTLAADTWHRDGTMMRGLVMDFPGDPNVRRIDDEYLFGRAFLVAPVSRYKARARSVYLPAGATWIDFHTGRRFNGGQRLDAAAPLARMPLFVRAGSIVPAGPDVQYVDERPDAPITLNVYPGADGTFELYEDDGLTNGYARGAYSRIPIRWDNEKRMLTIGDRSGSWRGMQQSRMFHIRWIEGARADASDISGAADRTVAYDGRAITIRK